MNSRAATRHLTCAFAFAVVLAGCGEPSPEVWYVDADATGANDGTSWTDGYADLQAALGVAVSGDEIRVAEGTYKPTSGTDRTISFALVDGVAVYGGCAGHGESDPDERDPAAHETILSGDIGTGGDDSDNSCHVVVGASNATLDGFTVTGGNANTTSRRGGGVRNWEVTDLTVANCVFWGNSADDGGGMYGFYCSPTVTNCTFSGNTASDAGGGMCNGGGSPTVTDCTFSENTSGWYGGGMCNLYGGYPTVTNCTFSGNAAGPGGGMCNILSSPTVTNCTFSGNTAGGGGGMYNYIVSAPTLTNCTFSGNTASFGGGILNGASSPSITNCTFSGNDASTSGGGIGNNESSPSVSNCIFWGDSAPAGAEIYNDGSSSCTVSCSDVAQVGGFTDAGGNVNADPKFVDADGADDIAGTLDDDLRLSPGSPCIDAADGGVSLATDKDGLLRHDDPGTANTGIGSPDYADMGAYEFAGASAGTVTGIVFLEDGADPAFVTITAGGQTASATVVGNTIEYAITDVPGTTTGVNVETAEPGYTVTGSPAPVTWVGTEGAATEVVVRRTTATPFGGGCGSGGTDSAALALCVLIACFAMRRRMRPRRP